MTAVALPAAAHTGQATQIEQARAHAEVLAAVEAAKRWPRDEELCEAKMRRACARPLVAERAFWAFPRAGEQVTGSTIHLAVTLAGIWGNVQYGVVELDRNVSRRESQMLAVAWELESNTRATTTFLVPHVRDTKNGRRDLTDLRDVYENNANMGARRVREMIFKVLPDWYTETGEDICRATLERSDKPISDQRAAIAKAYLELGVDVAQLEVKIGRAWDQTTPGDLAILRIVGKSIRRGEATVREQFPDPQPAPALAPAVTIADIAAAAPPAPVQPAAEPEPEPAAGDEDATVVRRRERRMHALLREAVGSDRDRRLALIAFILGRPVPSSAELTHDERGEVVTELEGWRTAGSLPDTAAAVLSASEPPDDEGAAAADEETR